MTEFLDYNDFLDECDAAVAELGLAGELQVASFHPKYQFAGTAEQDITNFTNRSPLPHAASIARGQRRARGGKLSGYR